MSVIKKIMYRLSSQWLAVSLTVSCASANCIDRYLEEMDSQAGTLRLIGFEDHVQQKYRTLLLSPDPQLLDSIRQLELPRDIESIILNEAILVSVLCGKIPTEKAVPQITFSRQGSYSAFAPDLIGSLLELKPEIAGLVHSKFIEKSLGSNERFESFDKVQLFINELVRLPIGDWDSLGKLSRSLGDLDDPISVLTGLEEMVTAFIENEELPYSRKFRREVVEGHIQMLDEFLALRESNVSSEPQLQTIAILSVVIRALKTDLNRALEQIDSATHEL